MKNVLPTSQMGIKSPNSCLQLTHPFLPRQAGLDGSQTWAALLTLEEVMDVAEVETTQQTGQKVSERGTGEPTGHAE